MKSYEEVLRYLLKYIFKDEPNSQPFQAILKATVEETADEDPVRKAFTRVLMKTIGAHDLSLQEAFHILNDLDFVTFGKSFVHVNVMGTRRVQENLGEATDPDREIMLARNLAERYWCREDDQNYQKACKEWQDMVETRRENPALVSLYKFASKYNKNWTHSNGVKVPHVTPNFNQIPNKKGRTERYKMFLKSLLLSHKPGTTLDGIQEMDFDQLEEECASFCNSPLCPKLTEEEFEESQKNLEEREGMMDEDGNEVDNPAGEEEDLLVLPEEVHEPIEQEGWMEWLREVQPANAAAVQEQLIRGEGDYDDPDMAMAAQEREDWDAAAISEGLTTEAKFKELGDWVKNQKQGNPPQRDFDALAGEPSDLNDKQLALFGIVRAWMHDAKEMGVEAMPQLLMNVSGAAGTGAILK